jgi:hypothetical protein
VLLHKRNKFPSVPLAHAADMKESYENMKLLLEKIQDGKRNWNICGDLKVIALLFGLQLGYTIFFAFCVSGIVGTGNFASKNSDLNKNRLF